MSKIRTTIAKALMPRGITGSAIDKITDAVEDDVQCRVFAISQLDVAKMRVQYRQEKEDIVIYAGRRDWQFRADGCMIGAGYGCCC